MLILITLLIIISSVKLDKQITIEDFLARPIPKHAEELTGQNLVDYVNKHQPFFKAKYSPSAERSINSRVMSAMFLNNPSGEGVVADINVDVKIPDRFDARERWPECTSIGYIRDQSNCGSCWAVSSAAVMSDRVCIQSNGTRKMIVSDGDILACCRSRCGFGCTGGWPIRTFNYATLAGVCTGGRYREKDVCKPYPFYPCGQHEGQPYYGPCPKQTWPTPKCRRVCYRKYPVPYQEDKIHGWTYPYNSQDSLLLDVSSYIAEAVAKKQVDGLGCDLPTRLKLADDFVQYLRPKNLVSVQEVEQVQEEAVNQALSAGMGYTKNPIVFAIYTALAKLLLRDQAVYPPAVFGFSAEEENGWYLLPGGNVIGAAKQYGVIRPDADGLMGQEGVPFYPNEYKRGLGWDKSRIQLICVNEIGRKEVEQNIRRYRGGVSVLKCNSTYIIPTNETIIKAEILTNGPVVATFRVYEDFAYYKGGVYVHTAGQQKGSHAVKVIGWGTENGTDYWLIANSWNTDWGEDGGYFRILRGVNHCEIENQMVAGKLNV